MSTRHHRKAHYRKQPKARSSAPIAWLISGIFIGMLIPCLIFWKLHASHSQLNQAIQDEPIIVKPKPTPKPSIKKKHEKPQSHYDFYNLLSPQEESAKAKKADNEDLEIAQPASFRVEIDTLKTFTEADQLKAQLALLGIEDINITKAGKSYRVVAGPYKTREEATKIQHQLEENAITSSLIAE